jgi:hypothetical protein
MCAISVLVWLNVSLYYYIHMFGCGEHHIEYYNNTGTSILLVVSSGYIFLQLHVCFYILSGPVLIKKCQTTYLHHAA